MIIAATSIGYSAHMKARVRDLERRLQHAEAMLQSHSQSLADTASAERIRGLEERIARAESAASQELLAARSGTPGLEQKIQIVPQQIKPHLEVLPPYVPDR